MKSKLDKDFAAVVEQINAKLKEATLALREANRLSDEAGLPGLIYTQRTGDYDNSMDKLSDEEREAFENDKEWDGESSPLKMKIDMIDVSDFEDQIQSAGWSASSSYC